MAFSETWFALVARMKSLQSAGELYARFQSYQHEDSYGAGGYLREQCGSVINALEEFRRDYEHSLPAEAIVSIDRFLGTRLASAAKDTSADHRAARGALVGLAAVEAEVTYIFSGRQEAIRSRSERSFLLLQRLIAVDEDVQSKWITALGKGEVACEKLGSVHLLGQGIYAFKIDAAGARSDLVFHEPPNDALLARSGDGLVLTEWKVATDADAAKKFASAKRQAELYKRGALAGSELTGYRYIVVVSMEALASVPPDEKTPDGVVYRHINITAKPSTPSKAATKAPKKIS